MTEPTSPAPPAAAACAPIEVNADPARDQIEAGVRQTLLAISAVAGALGYARVAGQASALLMASGALAGLIAFVWGQVRTRALASKAAAMAKALPDSVARAR